MLFITGSAQEAVDDLLFRLLFGEAEGHQLDELISGDLSDGSFMDQHRVDVVRLQRRDREDVSVVHDDRVALRMTAAGCTAVYAQIKLLVRVVTCN